MSFAELVHRVGGWLFVAGTGLILSLFLVAEQVDGFRGPGRVPMMFAGAIAIGGFLFTRRRNLLWSVGVAALSSAVTVVVAFGDRPRGTPGIAETGALLVLLVLATRRWDDRYGKAATLLLVATLMAIGWRQWGNAENLVAGEILIGFAVCAALGFGAYLRSADLRRRQSLAEVRRFERLELARDMHDFVAHHITGIVVQAQAAQFVSEQDPQRSRRIFADIEAAGLEALTAMRRTVGMLRGDDGAGVRPLGDMREVAELVDRFRHGDIVATFQLTPEVDAENVPAEIVATIDRVVRESLTNIRKHAGACDAVQVTVSAVRGGIEAAVRDNGRKPSGRSLLRSTGGGYGLAGLTERVAAVGGRLTAGPRPESGWEVVAYLPWAAGDGDANGSVTGDDSSAHRR